MEILSRLNVKKHFAPHIYERGLTYFNNDRVMGLSYDKNNESWIAHVAGTEDYYVDIQLGNLERGSINTYCECPAFDTYGSCKHIVAVLLAVQAQLKKKQRIKHNPEMIQDFFDQIIRSQQAENSVLTEKVPMKVEYFLQMGYSSKLYLQLKTGIDHCYVVRNIRDLLDAVMNNETYFFTNKFSYDPDSHYFFQQDIDILQQLHEIITTSDLLTDADYFGQNRDKRTLLLPPLSIKSLLKKLSERPVVVETDKAQFNGIHIISGESPIQYAVTRSDENSDLLVLKMEGITDARYFEQYNMFFAEGTFFFPSKEQLATLKHTMRIGRRNSLLPIQDENTDQFFSEVIPALKKSARVNISKQVSEEIVELPLKAKLYLETGGEAIIGKLEYHYGPHLIDPFNGKEKDGLILIRDVEKEQLIMFLIEQSNFHYNGKNLYIRLDEDEEIYDFLYTILPELDQHVDLFLSSEIRNMIVENEPIPSTNVQVQSNNNLLEVGFDISGVDEAEINAIIESVIEKKRFYRLNSGALLSLENEGFQSMQRLFNDLQINKQDFQDNHITMPIYRGAQIDELIETKKSYDPSFRKLLHQLRVPEEQVYEIPTNLHAELRHYQEIGFQWFKSLSNYHLGGILADDMGLGKTVQTIAYLLSEPSEKPHLVVVPSSVVYNWRNECEKFAPSLTIAMLTGTPEERTEKLKNSRDKDIWITSYGTIRQDIELYKDIPFQTLILDEAQFIKNYATKTAKAVRQLQAEKRFALSGTPIENSIDELWSIFQVILPGLMPSQKDFRQLAPEKIASLTKPFILRRIKEDVLKELPEKIESVHVSELTEEQKGLYVGYLQKLQQETTESIAAEGFQKSRMKILAGLTRLRQICCHPALFIENYHGKSGKLVELMQTVESFMKDGKRMLIFSQFTSMHDLIMAELDRRGIDYFYLHGQTAPEDRVKMSEAFNSGEKSVFLISLRAGGTGLNLTGADTVILYDLWWNPAVEDQAASRAHRFGQKKVVQVIRFLTEGTIEEKIFELQQKKRELIDQVIQPGETMLSSLSEEDVRELLSM